MGLSGRPDGRSAEGWRNVLLVAILRVSLTLGIVVALPAIYLWVQTEGWLVPAVDLFALLWLAVLAFHSSLSFRARALNFLLLVYLLGAWFVFAIGTVSQVYLLAVPVLAALFLGLRPALAALGLSVATILLVGSFTAAEAPLGRYESLPFLDWLIVALNFALIGAVLTISVATLLRKLEEALEETRRVTSAVEQASELFALADASGQITWTNAAFRSVFGALGEANLTSLAREEGVSGLEDALRSGRGWKGVLLTDGEGDQQRILETEVSALENPEGGRTEFLTVFRDVSRERKLQARLLRGEKLESLGTLAGGVAHDFNNVLGSILALAESGRDEAAESHLARKFDQIATACERARGVVRQMMIFARRQEVERRARPLREVVNEAIPLVRASAPPGLRIDLDIDEEGIVEAEEVELHQVVMNLCANAIHAMKDTPQPRLHLGLSQTETEEGVPRISLTVSDNGHGIPKELLDRIFDPFFTTKGPGEGTGLGLPSVYGIVTSMGGDIQAYSEPGQGATFRIRLPAVGKDRASPHREARTPASAPLGSGRVLLVDDEEAIRSLSAQYLTRLGYRVDQAPDGSAALERFRSESEAFDLVLTDLSMPRMGGVALMRAIHRIRPDIPVILASGFAEARGGDGSEEAAGFLQKPYTQGELVSRVRDALQSRGGRGAAAARRDDEE